MADPRHSNSNLFQSDIRPTIKRAVKNKDKGAYKAVRLKWKTVNQ